jgi:lipoyl(octanoyl) transferase
MRFILTKSPISYERYVKFSEKLRIWRKEATLLVEHTPVITEGKNSLPGDLLAIPEELSKKGIELISLSRGGQYTAHEPGQWVIYPHIDLEKRNWKLGDFLHDFIQTIQVSIRELTKVDLVEHRSDPGLYLRDFPHSKIVSIGIYAKRSFTSFGAAINASNDLSTFQWINPCGKNSSQMSNLELHSKVKFTKQEFAEKYQSHWRNLPKIRT